MACSWAASPAFAGKAVVLGGGVVGTHAARMAVGLGADVSIIDDRCRGCVSSTSCSTATCAAASTIDSIETVVLGADVVIGAVLVQAPAHRSS